MLSRVNERNMLWTRGVLLSLWFVLIGSLFWDPITPTFTSFDNLASPFHLHSATYHLRGEDIPITPYNMGNRIFWTMVVPILPLFLMVFGHEAWRRVCPLSFVSQLPRYLKFQRTRMSLFRRTGRIDRAPYIIPVNSWLHRNSWYVQIGLLFVGLCTRILFVNSSRVGLAIALMVVISAAMFVGYFWGGKSWCNYFCPVNVVQRIYTEPRGLLESAPHVSRPAIPQSMCRTSSGGVQKSACVNCTTNCGDIDLEQSYWSSIGDRSRVHAYYIFFGLIIGFYGYYFCYSGGWDYYFSGVWTHEDQLPALLTPGLYFDGLFIPIPKLIAVPLVIGLAGATTLGLGLLLEKAYRRLRRRSGGVTDENITNHCLAFSSWLSINTFYIFGGRPNLLLAPEPVVRAIDIAIVALTTLWLWQTVHRTSFKYRRDGLASSLTEQLKRLKVDVSKYFDGRSIDELQPDEIYVVSKVLPAFSQEQKNIAYRNILDDAITTGKTKSPQFLELLLEIRREMGISEEVHDTVLEGFGMVSSGVSFNAQDAIAEERARCIANYKEVIGNAIAAQIQTGRSMQAVLTLPGIQATIAIMRDSLQITGSDHAEMLVDLTARTGLLRQRLEQMIEETIGLLAVIFCVRLNGGGSAYQATLAELLAGMIDRHVQSLLGSSFGLLNALWPMPEAAWYASTMSGLASGDLQRALSLPAEGQNGQPWRTVLPAELVALFLGHLRVLDVTTVPPEGVRNYTARDLIGLGAEIGGGFERLVRLEEPVLVAVALTLMAHIDVENARSRCIGVELPRACQSHWLVQEVIDALIRSHYAESPDEHNATTLELRVVGDFPAEVSFDARYVTIGGALGNDLIVSDESVSPYHVAIQWIGTEFWLIRLDSAPVYVNGLLCSGERTVLKAGSAIEFSDLDSGGPVLVVNWRYRNQRFGEPRYDTITKLTWLSADPLFHTIGPDSLAQIAAQAEVRRFSKGDVIYLQESSADAWYVVQVGDVDRIVAAEGDLASQNVLALPSSSDIARHEFSLVVTSDFAVVLTGSMDALHRHAASEPKQISEPNVTAAA